MKKVMTSVALSIFVAVGAGAQTIYDAAKFTNKDLNGTARFVGMGGAMGALGGDISTIGTNPAGIGIYRSNDVMTSFGYSRMGTDSKFAGNKVSMNKDYWTFDNIGFVFSNKIGNHTPLRYVNFAFNYQRAKNFDKNMDMYGALGSGSRGADKYNISQVWQMADQAQGLSSAYYEGKQAFRDPNVGWLSALGWQGQWLVNTAYEDEYAAYIPGTVGADFRSRETGGIDQYDFNVSFNINDRVYLGLTVGAYDINYNKYTWYDEDFGNGEGYSLESWNKISGAGFDFKLGAIFRPIETSPLRIGVAVHTPTFYNLTQYNSAFMAADVVRRGEDFISEVDIDTYTILGGDNGREFRLRTPWKYNFSLGYTIGSSVALGAEYEFQDYSTINFRDPDYGSSHFEVENSTTSKLKGVNTLRLGAEYKVVPEFAIRAGYNYQSAIFKNNAFKDLPLNSVNTDTDFANSKSLNNVTVGLGYRGQFFYADLAYQYSAYKEDFYPFYEAALTKTDVKNSKSQVLLTLGMRF